MASYRGVCKEDIMTSLVDAYAFLQQHSSGPVCDAWMEEALLALDGGGTQTRMMAIISAADDAALAGAVQELPQFFSALQPLLYFHALNDTAGTGRRIYEGLARWDAFTAPAAPAAALINGEVKACLATEYTRRLRKAADYMERIAAGVAGVSCQDEAARMLAISALAGMVEMAAAGATDREIVELLNVLDAEETQVMLAGGAVASLMKNGTPQKRAAAPAARRSVAGFDPGI